MNKSVITKYHRLGGLNNGNVFLIALEVEKSKIKVPTRFLFLVKTFFKAYKGLQRPPFHCNLTQTFIMYMCVHELLCLCVNTNVMRVPPVRGFPGGSDGKESAWNVGDMGLIPGFETSPG